MHFCNDEFMVLVAFFSTLPFLGPWIRAKLASRKPHCCDKTHLTNDQ